VRKDPGRASDISRLRQLGALSGLPASDQPPGDYAAGVRVARESFRRGDLFEVVPSQVFFEPCPVAPPEVFRRLRERNPAPYGFLMNLGERVINNLEEPVVYISRADYDSVKVKRASTSVRKHRIKKCRAKQKRPDF